ncbi:MAG: copper amine oxidase N-terminal domain-containing protein [Acetobacteraceae bacterium]|nr:copper amine oxidase N-terminal domain-containing protein [Acetobacteraceae bacterium]
MAPALAFFLLATAPLGGGEACGPGTARAAPPRVPVLFANISRAGSDGWPVPRHAVSATGLRVDGEIMVKLQDLAQVLGAKVEGSGRMYQASRNGQTVRFYVDSPAIHYTTSYTITDPVGGRSIDYTHSWDGRAEAPTRLIDGQPWVSLNTAALALGALLVRYNPRARRAEVYDWRVFYTRPLSDPNIYVTGGPWLDSWEANAALNVSPNFRIGLDNLWDSGATDPSYLHQLKISASTLQSMENVLALTGIYFTPTNAFRSWSYNQELEGSWSRSYHMRGRAFDGGNGDLYRAAYADLRGKSRQPIDAESFWQTRNPRSRTGLYEIEKMPVGESVWLHGQREPGTDVANYGP